MNKYLIIDNNSPKSLLLRKKIENLAPSDWEYSETDYEYIFIVGGDGTFLRNRYKYIDKKIVAINGGNLGYYSYFNVSNLKTIFKKVIDQRYFFQPLTIDITINNKNYFCINEVLIRSDKVLETQVFINNVLLENYKGTGILVSTPLGSTGHAKNSGGAIVDPNLDLVQFIEIEPLTQKKYSSLKSPFILSSENKIVLKSKKESPASIILDGEKIEDNFVNNLVIRFNYAKFKMFKPDCKKNYLKKLRDSFVRDK
ncbi:MAG: NAD(+)/NADH kinase [Malacoplasma sp.]|nr:NAD(+)/NADH kinase [Malacoplasma sp.]MDE5841373.1 NAD(+)/NADH kinase [Malacoplasma sp.]